MPEDRVKPRTMSLLEQQAEELVHLRATRDLFNLPGSEPVTFLCNQEIQLAALRDSQRLWEAMWVRTNRPRHWSTR